MARGLGIGFAPWRQCILVAVLVLSGWALPASAQDLGVPDSNILVIDPGRLFAQSEFGKRVGAEIDARGTALAEENRRIEAELTAEEKALTEERPTLSPELFREKADAFDEKVRKTRSEQEEKANALARDGNALEQRFLRVARPVLEELMVETGASLLLDTRAVLLSAEQIDVTDEAVRRINAVIGDGSSIQLPDVPEEETPVGEEGAVPEEGASEPQPGTLQD